MTNFCPATWQQIRESGYQLLATPSTTYSHALLVALFEDHIVSVPITPLDYYLFGLYYVTKEKQPELQVYYWKEGVSRGCVQCSYGLSIFYYRAKDYRTSLKYALLGYSPVQRQFGYHYCHHLILLKWIELKQYMDFESMAQAGLHDRLIQKQFRGCIYYSLAIYYLRKKKPQLALHNLLLSLHYDYTTDNMIKLLNRLSLRYPCYYSIQYALRYRDNDFLQEVLDEFSRQDMWGNFWWKHKYSYEMALLAVPDVRLEREQIDLKQRYLNSLLAQLSRSNTYFHKWIVPDVLRMIQGYFS